MLGLGNFQMLDYIVAKLDPVAMVGKTGQMGIPKMINDFVMRSTLANIQLVRYWFYNYFLHHRVQQQFSQQLLDGLVPQHLVLQQIITFYLYVLAQSVLLHPSGYIQLVVTVRVGLDTYHIFVNLEL